MWKKEANTYFSFSFHLLVQKMYIDRYIQNLRSEELQGHRTDNHKPGVLVIAAQALLRDIGKAQLLNINTVICPRGHHNI